MKQKRKIFGFCVISREEDKNKAIKKFYESTEDIGIQIDKLFIRYDGNFTDLTPLLLKLRTKDIVVVHHLQDLYMYPEGNPWRFNFNCEDIIYWLWIYNIKIVILEYRAENILLPKKFSRKKQKHRKKMYEHIHDMVISDYDHRTGGDFTKYFVEAGYASKKELEKFKNQKRKVIAL